MVPPPFAGYPSGCPECGTTKYLFSCKCHAIFYCRYEHKRLHSRIHNEVCCLAIVTARQNYEDGKRELSGSQVKFLHPEDVLQIDSIYLTKSKNPVFDKCLKHRHVLARALRTVHTRQGLDESTDLLRWNTILRPESEYSAPRVVASYLIRASRDDECHAFLWQYTLSLCRRKKWLTDEQMATVGNGDPWNDGYLLHRPFVPSLVLIFATLIKLRMLTELEELEKINDAVTETVGRKLPLELLEHIRFHLFKNPILATRHNTRQTSYREKIVLLRGQIARLWWAVRARCRYMWPYLLDCRVLLRLECSRHTHRMGRAGCTLCHLKEMSKFHIEDAWKQSPGALEYITDMVYRYDSECIVGDDEFLGYRATLQA
ncbi:hypothetical protein P170DRAFT_474861 [Aspergillus steynii IBT 23096]|uniref:Suppressor of anucleate metulae protein B n=1 Tax=Aspergillus steynii IBT 23096 TaxID=1392250 RepID=A0A2I2GEK2_9EURO|nr:uncharacterized protein P170DRAFT_474861 [Aspergillus steynii IBT 23096]PLB51319.1 hypothetical protein P170DRAFT_474861 [Aspergillus steynii IBT 23096]